ncbi:MAG TPA: TonB-dependent receptor [Paludibacter sp.]|nr:TonB-dependent receptor [Paludibacter sp.]
MRKIFILFLLISVVAFQYVRGQERADSVNLSDVEVNASRNKLYSEMGRVLTVIEKAEITRSAVQSLDQLLDYVAGIDIRQRGVNTTQADISVRGGSFDQVLVLLNGVNITDPQTGHFNLDIPLNLSDVSRVEILQGSSARVLGPNAFSGAINIVTESSAKKALNVELTAGSFNTFGESVSGNFGSAKFHTFASVNHKSSDGYMANTDFNFSNAFAQSTLNTKSAGKFDLQLAAQLKDFGANSFYSLAYPNQFESSKTFMAALNWTKTSGRWLFNAQAYWRRHHDRFELIRDSISVKPVWYKTHNYHMTDVTGGKASAAYLSKLGKTTLGVDIRNEHIFSNVLGVVMDSMRAPLEKNGFFTKENNRLIETAMLDHSLKINKWYLSAGAAVTNSTAFGVNGFGGIDIAYEFNENVRIFADANSAVRLPTFTDLYYKSATQIANPNLQPEKSQTIEVGTKVLQSDWKLDATVFYRMGQNVIDWVQLPTETVWNSKNLTAVNALGTNLSVVHYFENSVIKKVSTSYSYLQMDKSAENYISKYALDYLKHKFIVSVDYQLLKSLSASWTGSYLVRSGTYTLPTTTVLQNYQPYFLLDGKLVWSEGKYDIFASANNIFDTKYFDYGGLTQPGINFNVGVRLKL